jgi:cell division protein FtsA
MNGTRLEVNVHIITVLKSSLNNLKRALKSASIDAKNIVLSGYASSIAVLNEDEKELGVSVIDIGGTTTDIVVHLGHSIRYNDFIGVGRANITNDLSMALHTPISIAEDLKIKYGSLLSEDTSTINIPSIGDENVNNEVSLAVAKSVIFARVEESLMLIANNLKNSDYLDKLGAGIVLTGGMTKLEGLRELAIKIFNNVPVRVAKPLENNIEGMFDTLKSPEFATTIGLILYGAGYSTSYEMDSNKHLRYSEFSYAPKTTKTDPDDFFKDIIPTNIKEENIEEKEHEIYDAKISKTNTELSNNSLEVIFEQEQKRGILSSFWNKLTNIF